MRCKDDVLIEMLNYCCRGDCYRCRGCNTYPDCLDVFADSILCNMDCNEVCLSMVAISFGMIDRGEW